MKREKVPSLTRWVEVTLLIIAAAITPVSKGAAAGRQQRAESTAIPESKRRPPILGADIAYAGRPPVMIDAFNNKADGDDAARAMKEAGVSTLRFSFHGFYSPLGPAPTERVKSENKLTNEYPWFPFDRYLEFIAAHDFTTVVAINVEEGPAVARSVVQKFVDLGILSKLVAVELSNEPWLNPRPWLPEDYAAHAADIISNLSSLGVKFALPLTVGNERKTPTRLSDSEWVTRMLGALEAKVNLSRRSDIYGVPHLYARGVSAGAIRKFNEVVRPFAPRMRYLITEFNIRSNLEGNPHLSNKYGMEFARKLAELMLAPEIEAMYVHSVPSHSIVYYSTRRFATVVGQRDPRIPRTREDAGWHVTPAGRVYALYSKLAWKGEPVARGGHGEQQYWAVRQPGGRIVFTVLNDSGKGREFKIKSNGLKLTVNISARTIACFDQNGKQLEALSLPY